MIDLGNGVKLIHRSEWGARAPRSRTGFTPSFGTTAHWEGPHMGTFPHSSCPAKVRGIQAFHMDSRGWVDIAYTALPCPHGYVFEGRWIGNRTAANGTNAGNSQAYACCYLGGERDGFTPEGARAMRAAMDYLDAHGAAGLGRNGHRDWKNTACPGDEIYGWVHRGQPVVGGTTASITTPQEATLSAAEVAEIKAHIDNQIRRLGSWLTTGGENALFSGASQPWIRDASTVTLDELDAAIDVADRDGYLAREEGTEGPVYFVPSTHERPVPLPEGAGHLRQWVEGLLTLAGQPTNVVDVPPDAWQELLSQGTPPAEG